MYGRYIIYENPPFNSLVWGSLRLAPINSLGKRVGWLLYTLVFLQHSIYVIKSVLWLGIAICVGGQNERS